MIPESLTTENDEIKFDLHEERTGQVLTGAITSLVDGQIARIWINEKHVVRQRFDASKDAFVDGCCSRSNFTVENVENGINVKRDKLMKERILLKFLFLINNQEDLTDEIKEKLFDKKRLYVAWNQLINLFKLLLFGSILSCCCLIIEIFYFVTFKCLKFLKCF